MMTDSTKKALDCLHRYFTPENVAAALAEDDTLPDQTTADDEADLHDAYEAEQVERWLMFRVRPECENTDCPF